MGNINLNQHAKHFVPHPHPHPHTHRAETFIGTMDNVSGLNSDDNLDNKETIGLFQKEPGDDDVLSILKNLTVKNHNRIIIGNLNKNSINNKLDALKTIITGNIDIFLIIETKLDETFEIVLY